MITLYTIGHSTHTIDNFIHFLKMHKINALCDVRSKPFSRFNPQFNRSFLENNLEENKIRYIFLGRELGARSEDPLCYIDGKVDYNSLAATDLFQKGIRRLLKGAEYYNTAMMCAEKDPITCHRTILICRELRKYKINLNHILDKGRLETQRESELRLLNLLGISYPNLFCPLEELIENAYELQGRKIAYSLIKSNDNTLQLSGES